MESRRAEEARVGTWMSGVTAGGWAPQVLVRCATCCVPHAGTPSVGHTFLRHFLRGPVNSNISATVCPGSSVHGSRRASLCPFHSASFVSASSLEPCHRALRLLHQRYQSSSLSFVFGAAILCSIGWRGVLIFTGTDRFSLMCTLVLLVLCYTVLVGCVFHHRNL